MSVNLEAVRTAIKALLPDENHDDGSWAPLFIRLGWHASGTYCQFTQTGGSNGACMRFAPESKWDANAGLGLARDRLEAVKKQFPAMSYADIWTFAAVVAVEAMGGPKVPWRGGRSDCPVGYKNPVPDGRLPDGDKGADHIRAIFYRMGFSDQEIVALSGAHGVGRCHKDRSGFDGPWTFSPTRFSNLYFKDLFKRQWTPRKWDGPIQMEDKSGKLMMLTTDMALTTDPVFKPFAQLYAKDKAAFFRDFSSAFSKLLELGLPRSRL